MQKKNNAIELISVIIPTYNEEKYLKKCLDSLQNQTYPNFEILVIDDGSIDRSVVIVSNYDVKLWSISHAGPGNARNFGAKKAKGKILVFIDADMYLDKNYINNLIKPIISGQCVGSYTTAEYVGNADNIWAKCWNITHDIPGEKRIDFFRDLKHLVFRAIRTDIFFTLKGFNPRYGYYDDKTLTTSGLKAISVSDAICYHNNPSTLIEVFQASRWIGRSIEFKLTLKNILRYSIFNSIRISIKKISRGAPFFFVFFKIVFDFGILSGMLFKNAKLNYAK